jgi:hypothetical protein
MKKSDRVLLPQHPGQRENVIKCIIAQMEGKMNIDEVILELKERIQEIEDAKTSLTESQEELRETIAALEMEKEVEKQC